MTATAEAGTLGAVPEPLEFVVPAARDGQAWQTEINTYDLPTAATTQQHHAGDGVTVGPRSVTVLRSPQPRPNLRLLAGKLCRVFLDSANSRYGS
jgi:hypothetical protein